jgi:hypothetical protein
VVWLQEFEGGGDGRGGAGRQPRASGNGWRLHKGRGLGGGRLGLRGG